MKWPSFEYEPKHLKQFTEEMLKEDRFRLREKDKQKKDIENNKSLKKKGHHNLFLLPLLVLLLSGCEEINGFITEVENRAIPGKVESELTPEDVVKLYLTLSGQGRYVMAYELLTDEQKMKQTVEDIEKYGELGKSEVEKILDVQQKDGVSLVTAAIKHTDQETQKTRYQVQEFILTKEIDWRIVSDKDLLDNGELKTINGLVLEQANAIKNSPETKEFITWMNEKNSELLGAAKVELFEQAGYLKQTLSNVVHENKDEVTGSAKTTVDYAKEELEQGLNNLNGKIFGD